VNEISVLLSSKRVFAGLWLKYSPYAHAANAPALAV
jgi:hypothetical protein